MQTFRFICLANSFKLGGRCIAGLNTDGSGWLRPISAHPSGTLKPEYYSLRSGREPELFELLELDFSESAPRPHQPENWLLGCYRWRSLGMPTEDQLQDLLWQEKQRSKQYSDLFGNRSDRVAWRQLVERPARRSLCLIWPSQILWQVTTREGKRKFRAAFSWQGANYDLSITDPLWRDKLAQLQDGTYNAKTLAQQLGIHSADANRFIFTISLGEPFSPNPDSEQQFCYKLIAAVIHIDQARQALGLVPSKPRSSVSWSKSRSLMSTICPTSATRHCALKA